MQHLNNDMDELMRKAAEHYPLKPAGMDWEKVAGQLQAADTPAQQKTSGGKYLFFLLTFLLLYLVCDNYYRNSLSRNDSSGGTSEAGFNSGNVLLPQAQQPGPSDNKNKIRNSDPSSDFALQNELLHQRLIPVRKQREPSQIVVLFVQQEEKQKPSDVQNNNDAPVAKVKEENNTAITAAPEASVTHPETENISIANEPDKKNGQEPEQNNAIVHEQIKQQKSSNKLYISLLMGPDVSTVKMQQTEGVGYSIGALAGYQVFKKLSLETGLFRDRKNYYSKGTYFKPDKLYLPSHSTIIQAEGYCNMFEWPLNLRYQFIQNKKGAWYALAGVSSYLMQKEEYEYLYERYNVQYSGSKYYTRSSKDWFAVLNISAGYEHKLGRLGSLRIEPYLKLPLKGVGVGYLPLTSSGLYLGFTYPLE